MQERGTFAPDQARLAFRSQGESHAPIHVRLSHSGPGTNRSTRRIRHAAGTTARSGSDPISRRLGRARPLGAGLLATDPPQPSRAGVNRAGARRHRGRVRQGRAAQSGIVADPAPTLTAQFSQGVDAEQSVDWSGGKPWQAVLHDVVQPLHLRAAVSGGTVRIDPAQD